MMHFLRSQDRFSPKMLFFFSYSLATAAADDDDDVIYSCLHHRYVLDLL